MAKLLKVCERVERFLRRKAKNRAWGFEDAPDSRQQAKVTHKMPAVLNTMLSGLLAARPTLRDVEAHAERTHLLGVSQPKRISDSCLHAVASRNLDEEYLLNKLVHQVRQMARDKMLKPTAMPCGVIAIDGKNLATLSHGAEGRAHHRSNLDVEKWCAANTGGDYWIAPVLRATLVSAPQKPCIYQAPIEPGTGEATAFGATLTALKEAYGRGGLFKIISADAGLCSLSNADHVVASGYDYVFGLKGNQKALFEEAQERLLGRTQGTQADIATDWERRGGSRIQRELWRSIEFGQFTNTAGTWQHLRQIWLVRQTTKNRHGACSVEDRFFITSVARERLTSLEVLTLVRGHWGIENDTFNSLDLQWREDSGPWSTQGNAVWALGLLRLMAYNLVQHLRHRHLCKDTADGKPGLPLPWRRVFEYVSEAMLFATITKDIAAPATS